MTLPYSSVLGLVSKGGTFDAHLCAALTMIFTGGTYMYCNYLLKAGLPDVTAFPVSLYEPMFMKYRETIKMVARVPTAP